MVEWQGAKEGERDVKVRLDIGKKSLLVFTAQNVKRPTRTIDCNRTETFTIIESSDKQRTYLLVRIPNEYDLVSEELWITRDFELSYLWACFALAFFVFTKILRACFICVIASKDCLCIQILIIYVTAGSLLYC